MRGTHQEEEPSASVSVLFNEPKLLKCGWKRYRVVATFGFSALQRAEIAEIVVITVAALRVMLFQCSSTSRNC